MRKIQKVKSEINKSDWETKSNLNNNLGDLMYQQQHLTKQIASNGDNLFEVNFFDENTYKKYGSLLEKIIKKKFRKKIGVKVECRIEKMHAMGDVIKLIYKRKSKKHNYHSDHKASTVIKRNCSRNEEEIQRKNKGRRQNVLMKEQSPNPTGVEHLFKIDVEPSSEFDVFDVPSYKRFSDSTLGDNDKKESANKNDIQYCYSERTACFNCGNWFHRLSECTLPRDRQRIRKAIKLFKQNDRYYKCVDKATVFIEPGKISDSLREAMDLQKGELPFFFYRMRLYGYPPGWLEYAKIERSHLVIYDGDGSEFLASGEGDESADLSYRYNGDLFIDFPGYNQYPGDNFNDEYRYHNVPRFSHAQSKERFIKNLGVAVCYGGYKRKKLTGIPTMTQVKSSNLNTTTHTSQDIEVINSNNNSIEGWEGCANSDSSNLMTSSNTEQQSWLNEFGKNKFCTELETTGSDDDSLIDEILAMEMLDNEQQQQQQQQQHDYKGPEESIEMDSIQMNGTTDVDDNLEQPKVLMQSTPLSLSKKSLELYKLSPTKLAKLRKLRKLRKCSPIDSKSQIPITRGGVTKTYLGTPIYKFSLYDRLPSYDKFKEGISDIAYWQVPTTPTGTYEKLKKIFEEHRRQHDE